MVPDNENLFEELSFADRKPVRRSRPARSYSPRYDRRRKPVIVPGARRRLKRNML